MSDSKFLGQVPDEIYVKIGSNKTYLNFVNTFRPNTDKPLFALLETASDQGKLNIAGNTRVAATIAERNALTVQEGDLVYVSSAVADPTVNVGGALYVYGKSGWAKLAEEDELDRTLVVETQVDFTTSEPGAPTDNQAWINTVAGVSSGTGQTLAQWDVEVWNGTDWTEIIPYDGMTLYDKNLNQLLTFNGATWDTVGGAVGSLQQVFDTGQAITIADTDNQVLAITQNDVTNNPSALTVTNTGTGTTLLVDHDGATGSAVSIDHDCNSAGPVVGVLISSVNAGAGPGVGLHVDDGLVQIDDGLYLGADAILNDNDWDFTAPLDMNSTDIIISGGLLSIGQEDTLFYGRLRMYGRSTGAADGGIITMDTAADHDTTIANYQVAVEEDDFRIGPDTNTDALKYDGGTSVWGFTAAATNTVGFQSLATSVTADGSGAAIPAFTRVVEQGTTTDANDILVLQAPSDIGEEVTIYTNGTGCELRSDGDGSTINGVDCGNTTPVNELALAASSIFLCRATSTTSWVVTGVDSAGAAIATLVPDAV